MYLALQYWASQLYCLASIGSPAELMLDVSISFRSFTFDLSKVIQARIDCEVHCRRLVTVIPLMLSLHLVASYVNFILHKRAFRHFLAGLDSFISLS